MKVRQYLSADAAAVKHIWGTVLPDTARYNQPAFALERKLAIDDLIFVAEHDGAVVGTVMAGYDGHRGWLYLVAVLPKHRRHGTGARLVEAALSALAGLGCVKVNLQVRPDNKAVTAFYESVGFTVEPRINMGLKISSEDIRSGPLECAAR
jgi:ribosomal protein S18 acetylase RimI-like enzyme